MIRSALILCAGIIIATCFACAPTAPPASVAGPTARPAATCSTADFAKKIAYYTDSNYQPAPGAGPPTTSPFPTDHNYVQDLVAVFKANPAFQQQLCQLDAVYVSGYACTSPEQCFDSSWGWRQSIPTIGAGRVVAVSQSLWNEPNYSQYETDLMQTVLPVNGAYYSGAASCPAGNPGENCPSVDNFTMALMGALAHEVGHVLWYDLVSQYDPSNPGTGAPSNPNNFCGGTFFVNNWQTPVTGPPRWRDVLTPQQRHSQWGNNWPNMHKSPPHIRDIDNSGNAGYRANQTAALLAAAQPWASIFASVSPDEDFVETYKFMVLASATTPLNWVKITIPTAPPSYLNVAADYAARNKPLLASKITCIQTALASSR